jgi:hypothetical protein
LQPRVATKKGVSLKCEHPAYPDRSSRGSAIQSFESPVLLAQTGEGLGLVEWVQRTVGREFLRLLTAARARVGTTKNAANRGSRIDVPLEGCFEDLNGLADSPLA